MAIGSIENSREKSIGFFVGARTSASASWKSTGKGGPGGPPPGNQRVFDNAISIAIVNRQRLPLPRAAIRRAAELALGRRRWALTVVFVELAESRRINRRHLRHDYPADVLSFDLSEGRSRQGEIIVCPGVARRESVRFGAAPREEIVRYVVHGILHLLGYDDHKPVDYKKMWKKQEAVVSAVFCKNDR